MSNLCDRLLDDKAFEQVVLTESLEERDEVDVSKNYITCSGIEFMCSNWVERWRNRHAALLPRFILRILKAHHDYIGDAGAITLAELLNNQGLQDLDELHLSREHRARPPEPRIYPAAVRSPKRTHDNLDDRLFRKTAERRLSTTFCPKGLKH